MVCDPLRWVGRDAGAVELIEDCSVLPRKDHRVRIMRRLCYWLGGWFGSGIDGRKTQGVGMAMVVKSEILEDASAFVRIWNALERLRCQVGAEGDVTLDPIHFLASTDDQRRSCSVAVWRDEELIGLLYATQHYARGTATGYTIGGDFTGRGLLVCAAKDEHLVLRESMLRLSKEGVHSMHFRMLPRAGSSTGISAPLLAPSRALKLKTLDAVIPGDLLRLGSNFEEFLGALGKHTRRNIRAFLRKTAENGIEFVGNLSSDEYGRAVSRLNSETDFPAEQRRLEKDERLLELHAGERMGLRASDGTIIAVLCGFRREGRFYLMTQLNDAHYERFSLSLVLRAHAAEYLIGNGIAELHFMGGSSLSFGRYCDPESYRSIFADRRHGLAAVMKTTLSFVAGWLRRAGRRVPERLAILCGGKLDDQLLAERTVLRPAAMLMSQREQSRRSGKAGATDGETAGEARSPLLGVSA